jgi:hypothetical protein
MSGARGLSGAIVYGVALAPKIAQRGNAFVWWRRCGKRRVYGWKYLVRQWWQP